MAWSSVHSLRHENVAHQGHLEAVVTKLFRGEDIKLNALKEPFKNNKTGRSFELDIWIPSVQLGIEFQDAYHYSPIWYYQQSLSEIEARDYAKDRALHEQGATAVSVPCWWDLTQESLAASIQFVRPDLLQQHSLLFPVPLNPPLGLFLDATVPGIGQVMLASTLPSVALKPALQDSETWWMGEKYDGVRCIWHPADSTLYTRRGVIIHLPSSFIRQLSHTPMDGELWFGRGNFHEFSGLVEEDGGIYAFLRNIVFDNPNPKFQTQPFEDRYASLLEISAMDFFVIIAGRILCKNYTHVKNVLSQVISDGGEGVILRKSYSAYENNRSSSLIKLKASRGDTEALVISLLNTEVGLELPNGVKFKAGSPHIRPKIGDVVTVDYDTYSLKEGAPVNPKITRIRHDLDWEVVMDEYIREGQPTSSHVQPEKAPTLTKKETGYWTSEKGIATREFFVRFAQARGLDPFVSQTWYSLSRYSFLPEQSGQTLPLLDGNYVKTLQWVFPELELNPERFSKLPIGYWDSTKNRRKLLDNLATKYHLNPLVPKDWYYFVETNRARECQNMLAIYYRGSIGSALMHLYPDIGLEKHRFVAAREKYWDNEQNQRLFFELIAKRCAFDPLVATSWYSVSKEQIMIQRGIQAILKRFGKSIPRALIHLYPNIGLKLSKMQSLEVSRWSDVGYRKQFFLDFAEQLKFDPLIPQNWYNVSKANLMGHKGIRRVAAFHGGVIRALKALFPNVEFHSAKFCFKKRPENTAGALEILNAFANRLGFDPLQPANWYCVKANELRKVKGGRSLLQLHKGGLAAVLMQTYPTLRWDKSKFPAVPHKYWQNKDHQKEFFTLFAREQNFEPLVPENWYKISAPQLFKFKGIGKIIENYNGSFVGALLSSFPDIGIARSNFSKLA
eukprot:Phypoly_transcript_02539.p1 GENE.Phypoly_transcript_02539~~Phypoly_transcript_02539.p1  ORF type:complete len:901 (+),score=86.30 Phypoly_transcript_02539:60-2762(+)